jgi:pimeloyl-ACP methyl ester carboxylesterase
MSAPPILLFLHGVGDGDQDDNWRDTLERSLAEAGYPSLDHVTVIAPKYPNGLRGVDDDEAMPKVVVKAPRGDDAKANRRDFERRRTAMEILLGSDDPGGEIPGIQPLAELVASNGFFAQAENYARKVKIRAWVLQRVLKSLPSSGRIVIVGHSLGSVIAADLVRRLPSRLEIAGMVTIGSPLAQRGFALPDLRDLLADPPTTMAWWAMVSVRPEVSRMTVLISGRPKAGSVSKAPPIAAGPLAGHPAT